MRFTGAGASDGLQGCDGKDCSRGAYWVMYVAKFADAIYVLHAFLEEICR